MKKLHLLITMAAILLAGCYTSHCAPGDIKTNSVTLAWDQAPEAEYITHHKLYVRHDFPPGMPRTNAVFGSGEGMGWYPPVDPNNPTRSDTNGWTLLQTITNLAPDRTLLNVTNVTVALTNKAMFFVITANNNIGESFFSNVAWIPSRPSSTNQFRLLSVE